MHAHASHTTIHTHTQIAIVAPPPADDDDDDDARSTGFLYAMDDELFSTNTPLDEEKDVDDAVDDDLLLKDAARHFMHGESLDGVCNDLADDADGTTSEMRTGPKRLEDRRLVQALVEAPRSRHQCEEGTHAAADAARARVSRMLDVLNLEEHDRPLRRSTRPPTTTRDPDFEYTTMRSRAVRPAPATETAAAGEEEQTAAPAPNPEIAVDAPPQGEGEGVVAPTAVSDAMPERERRGSDRDRVAGGAMGAEESDAEDDETEPGQQLRGVQRGRRPRATEATVRPAQCNAFGLNVNIDLRDIAAFNAEVRENCQLSPCIVCAQALPPKSFPRREDRRILDLDTEYHQALLQPIAKIGDTEYQLNDIRHYRVDPVLAERRVWQLCVSCRKDLSQRRIPKFCYANYPIMVTPAELQGLSYREQVMISPAVAMQQLTVLRSSTGPAGGQSATTGFCYAVATRNPEVMARELPRIECGSVEVRVERRVVSRPPPRRGGGADPARTVRLCARGPVISASIRKHP